MNLKKGRSIALAFGNQLASVTEGFSCNVHSISMTPHCNGTHTEGVGHISQESVPLQKSLAESFFHAQVISLSPKPASETTDSYSLDFEEGDLVIDLAAVASLTPNSIQALIIRTLPNDLSKSYRDYEQEPPCFFTKEAMEHLRSIGIDHLLVDIPSLDKLDDGGHLACHRIFFGLASGSSSPNPASLERSVTEMIFVNDDIEDGRYTLQIQCPAFDLEAVPSNPVLYPHSFIDALANS